jgi:hypothetical protein
MTHVAPTFATPGAHRSKGKLPPRFTAMPLVSGNGNASWCCPLALVEPLTGAAVHVTRSADHIAGTFTPPLVVANA